MPTDVNKDLKTKCLYGLVWVTVNWLRLPQHYTIFPAANWNNYLIISTGQIMNVFSSSASYSCRNVNYFVDSYDLPKLYLLT